MSRSTPPAAAAPTIRNKRALHKFEVVERIECGIALVGSEVKSVRLGHVVMDEAFARFRGTELWLHGLHIGQYAWAGNRGHEPGRLRKLLLHRREIDKLAHRTREQGLTMVPLALYFSPRGIVKVELAVVRGKTQSDKRETLRKKEHTREMERAMRKR